MATVWDVNKGAFCLFCFDFQDILERDENGKLIKEVLVPKEKILNTGLWKKRSAFPK